MGGNRDYFFGNTWESDCSLRFPKAGNGNRNEVIRMGGNQWRRQNVKTARSFPGQYGRKAGRKAANFAKARR